MKKLKKFKKINYRHYICAVITLGFIACAIFVFPKAFTRIIESLKDIWNSLVYYFTQLLQIKTDVTVTVNEYSLVPWTPFLGLPATWEEFLIVWDKYWQVWATADNVTKYFAWLSTFLFDFSRIILLAVVPIVLVLVVLFNRYLQSQNNDYNKESKPLKFFKWLTLKTYAPIKRWVLNFITFVKEHSFYYKIWFLIWAYNFNVLTIFIEFIAFYLYFVLTFDFLNLYKQFYKLFVDISVPIAFIPSIVWLIIAYVILVATRKKIGYQTLNHMESKNCGFINERPIVSFICGTMGKKKTTTLTDMALSEEVMLRDKAFELILKCDLKFPNFLWINFENYLRYAISTHLIYNLATIKKLMNHIKYLYTYETTDKAVKKSIKRRLNKLGLDYNNPLFGYDYTRYGLYYNDNLQLTDIWQVLTDYAELYFIYVVESSLIISNYSVRTDNIKQDIGNFPLWNDDFFKRDVTMQQAYSRHAKILDFDMLRLGKKVLQDNPKANFFEFGVVLITEVGKERKNAQTLLETKVKDLLANQKNDGFNDSLKMIRHSATVCNFPFVKIITDEQRPESWGADARDLCEIVYIEKSGETALAMPFFAVAELLYSFFSSKFDNFYYQYRFNRADNTLLMYLLKNLFAKFNDFYVRTYNTFGYCTLKVQVESGTQDGARQGKLYYLMFKKIYSKRFSTDCLGDFYYTRALRSDIGLWELDEYKGVKATVKELELQNSYFVQDLMNKHKIDKE